MEPQYQESRNHAARALLCLMLSVFCTNLLFAANNKMTTAKVARQPFVSFKAIDLRLTTIDRNLQALTALTNDAEKLHSAGQRAHALAEIRNSTTMKSLRRSSVSVLATTREVELHYRNRRQRYGVIVYGSLHGKAVRMVHSEMQLRRAATMAQFIAAQRRFAADLLTFVLQFQAVSGGYGALQCGTGQWACCQPRSTEQGKLALRGCTWICATTRSACKTGCLGPRVPKTARAAMNNARNSSQAK